MEDELPTMRRKLPSFSSNIKEKLILYKCGILQETDCSPIKAEISLDLLHEAIPILYKSSSIQNKRIKELKDRYTILSTLSETENVLIRKAKYSTGQLRVIKSIKLSTFTRKSLKVFKKALDKCRKVSSPSMVSLYEYFIGKSYIHICVEYCSGISLDEYVLESQTDISQIKSFIRQILSVLNCLGKSGILVTHLNTKDFWFVTESKNSPIKFVGFEHLVVSNDKTYKKSKCASKKVKIDFSPMISVWELGVILIKWLIGLYMLISNNGKIHSFIIWKALLRKQEDLSKYFPGIPKGLKDFISKAIVLDASKRATPSELLMHSWLKIVEEMSKPITDLILNGLYNVNRSNKLQLDVLKYISSNIYTYSNTYPAHQAFVLLDKQCNGAISFKDILGSMPNRDSEKALFDGFSKLNNYKKLLSYKDFLAGMVDWSSAFTESNIAIVFRQLEEFEGAGLTRSQLDFFLRCNDPYTRWQEIVSIIGHVRTLNQHHFYTLIKDS